MFHFSGNNIELELRDLVITPADSPAHRGLDGTVMFSVIDVGQLSDYGCTMDDHWQFKLNYFVPPNNEELTIIN